jgi:hypothetical protein
LSNFITNQTKEDEICGSYGTYGREQKSYRILVRNPKGKRTLGRSRNGWENNIKMDFTERERNNVDCIIRLRTGKTGGLL